MQKHVLLGIHVREPFGNYLADFVRNNLDWAQSFSHLRDCVLTMVMVRNIIKTITSYSPVDWK